MIGYVTRIAPGGAFCFIKGDKGEEFFAHKKDFPHPKCMKVAQYVTFVPGPLLVGKRNRPAMDLKLIQQAA
ncbi:MAG TPA: hypothetical protein VGB69_01825 [Edaphobacter sp.]